MKQFIQILLTYFITYSTQCIFRKHFNIFIHINLRTGGTFRKHFTIDFSSDPKEGTKEYNTLN